MGATGTSGAGTSGAGTSGAGTPPPGRKRVAVPAKVRDEVMGEFNHRCAVCGADKPQLHHLNEDPSDNDPRNLIPLCPNCHLSDQHDPTRGIEVGRLRLFRAWKDPYILYPQFQPVYKRMCFLDGVPEVAEALQSPQVSPAEVRSLTRGLAGASEDLISFCAAFEKGNFYGPKLQQLIGWKRKNYMDVIDEGYGRRAAARDRHDLLEYCQKLVENRASVEELTVEMLRYQNWPAHNARRT